MKNTLISVISIGLFYYMLCSLVGGAFIPFYWEGPISAFFILGEMLFAVILIVSMIPDKPKKKKLKGEHYYTRGMVINILKQFGSEATTLQVSHGHTPSYFVADELAINKWVERNLPENGKV